MMSDRELNLSLEQELAELYVTELRKLATAMDWPKHQSQRLTLHVDLNDDKATFEVSWIKGRWGGEEVKGSTFGVVMDEVHRRQNYNDREEGRIERSMTALPKPSSEEPF